jgi:hypothetical protein
MKGAVLAGALVITGVLLGGAVGRMVSRRPMDSATRELATRRDWARAGAGVRAPSAGLSMTVDPAIRRLDPGRLGKLVESEGYHAFLHRCSSCHVPPDPSMHEPGEWQGIVRRMSDWIRAVGVMPMPAADSAAINALLERAAARRE